MNMNDLSPRRDEIEDDLTVDGSTVAYDSNRTRRLNTLKEFDRKYARLIKKIHNTDVDPLRQLGPGISTYHQLLLMLFVLFFILTVLHIPVLQLYAKHDYYDGGFSALSLGNLGFSKTECQSSTMMPGSS